MFTAALFTTAKIWKPPNYPSVDNWIKKINLHKGGLLTNRNEWNLAICDMGGPKG